MGRTENVQIFDDTRKMCKSNPELINAIRASAKGQEYILEAETFETKTQEYSEPAPEATEHAPYPHTRHL